MQHAIQGKCHAKWYQLLLIYGESKRVGIVGTNSLLIQVQVACHQKEQHVP